MKRFITAALTAALLAFPASALDEGNMVNILGSVTVNTIGDITFDGSFVGTSDNSFSFDISLGNSWVLRGIEVIDKSGNSIDFEITGKYSYSFEVPDDGAVIFARSEDHGTASRADAVVSIWKLAGSPMLECEPSYSDVSVTSDYFHAITWAEAEGIINSGEIFRPDDPITREELAVVLYRRAMALELEEENDKCSLLDSVDRDSISEWALEAVCWNVSNGVMKEASGASGYFMPQASLTRNELNETIDMLVRMTLPEDKSDMGSADLSKPEQDSEGSDIQPDDSLSNTGALSKFASISAKRLFPRPDPNN